MKRISYTYCVVRYVHDPAASEMLNIGVILCAASVGYLGIKFEPRYERLSDTFVNFDGQHYRRVIRDIEAAIFKIKNRQHGNLFLMHDPITDANQLSKYIIPDQGLAFQLGPMLSGITSDPQMELKYIFNRMVASQYSRKRGEKRTDDEVWHVYHRPLVHAKVNRYLRPKKFVSDAYELKFEHAFKNEKWQVLQPATMDYAKPESLQVKATRLLGAGTALQDERDLGKLYLLLGPPRTPEHQKAYIKAKNLLHRIPINHEIIEEDEAEEFAAELAEYIRKHGIDEVPDIDEDPR